MRHSEEISLEVIPWGSPAYKQALELRDRILRKPLGMSIYKDNLEGEKEDIHLLARQGGTAVGVLLLRRVDDHTLQMKQVAVDESLQGQGIGRQLIAFAERTAILEETRTIILHARMTAVPFYEKLGYVRYGEPYTEIGIPHWSMKKQLEPGSKVIK
ncbi:GNAT family N-acetyltransferase [Paenibacillus physcomitrellae]|uniref:Acetyltransferase n=1 Tax=Paenibacillus physcomitrellae TaxID=1619311 RepID=A0ABQ1FQN1_9BACL|nr:GNAT family N-acetyltransferase [Paenibacillus physcomitrellae]GGA26869.1 acetyltransferase [Paenibacillus physcomitrellae]